MKDITLAKYVRQEKSRVDRFSLWWRQKRAEDSPVNWPLRLSPGDWDEQLQMFKDEQLAAENASGEGP